LIEVIPRLHAPLRHHTTAGSLVGHRPLLAGVMRCGGLGVIKEQTRSGREEYGWPGASLLRLIRS
jgi:hypothetical protein